MKTHRGLDHIAFTYLHDSIYTFFVKSLPVLGIVILTSPVLQGCSFTEVETRSSVKIAVRKHSSVPIRTIDAFVFNDDAIGRLDCYQRIDGFTGNEVHIGSCRGNKVAVLCANAPWDRMEWSDIYSLHKTGELKIELEDEDPDWPVMTSVIHFRAGEDTQLTMERLTSEVVLRSINCDFSGKPYAGESITDAKVYLTNINGTYSILPSENETIERVINHGSLIMDDINFFKKPTSILKIVGTISSTIIYPKIRLLCYPNTSSEESAGTPFTRLVIEGKIQGETWYWPININRGQGNDHEGVERNMRYIYDITIRTKGTKDPDAPIIAHMAETIFEIEEWDKKDSYHIAF